MITQKKIIIIYIFDIRIPVENTLLYNIFLNKYLSRYN